MYSYEETIIVIISEILCLVSIPFNEIMIRYLKNKPPGMQTFLDVILIDTHRTFQILSFLLHTTYCIALCLAPFHKIIGEYILKCAFRKIDGKLASLYQKNLPKMSENRLYFAGNQFFFVISLI